MSGDLLIMGCSGVTVGLLLDSFQAPLRVSFLAQLGKPKLARKPYWLLVGNGRREWKNIASHFKTHIVHNNLAVFICLCSLRTAS